MRPAMSISQGPNYRLLHERLAVNLFKHPFLSTPSSDFTRMVDSCSALGLHSWCMRRGACILVPATLQGTRTAYL